MAESVGKRFGMVDDSLLNMLPNSHGSALSFSKGFDYQDQNLNDVQLTPEEARKSNRIKTEKYIGETIPTKKMTKDEIDSYFDGLTTEQVRWILEKANTNEYDQNTLVAYVNHRDEWENPNADGIGMFEKKGSSSSRSYWKPLGWVAGTFGATEGVGRSMSAIGNYQFNRTMDKYLPEDVSRLVRHAKYENAPEVLSEKLAETNEQIKKAEQRLGKSVKNKLINGGVDEETRRNLEELYARRDSIKESLDAIESTKKKLPTEKPETARETAKRMKLKGSDLKAAGQASVQSSVYYTTELAPMYKQVKTKFNMGSVFDSLTKEDFPGLTESEWNDLKEIINKEKEAYSKYGELSAEEFHKKMGDFDLSKQKIKGEDPTGLTAKFKDAVHTKMNNLLDEVVERELPGQNFKNKKLTYNNMLNIENELKDYAVSGGKRKSQSMLKDLKDSTTRSVKIRRGLGTNLRTAGEKITPTKQLPKIIDGIKNLVSKIKNATATTTENVVEKTVNAVNPKNLINPNNFKQPKLLGGDPVSTLQLLEGLGEMWDSMLGGDTQVGDIAETIRQMPVMQAADAVDDALRASYMWSLLSEDEKPYYIQDILEDAFPGETFTIEEAEEMVRMLKENGSLYLQPHSFA